MAVRSSGQKLILSITDLSALHFLDTLEEARLKCQGSFLIHAGAVLIDFGADVESYF